MSKRDELLQAVDEVQAAMQKAYDLAALLSYEPDLHYLDRLQAKQVRDSLRCAATSLGFTSYDSKAPPRPIPYLSGSEFDVD